MLSTGDYQKRNYPDLYPSQNIVCPCNIELHDNYHIGLCSHYRDTLFNIPNQMSKELITTLETYFDTFLKTDRYSYVNCSPIFNTLQSGTDLTTIPLYHYYYTTSFLANSQVYSNPLLANKATRMSHHFIYLILFRLYHCQN